MWSESIITLIMTRNCRYKFLPILTVFLFAIPTITSYCCCVEFPWQKNSHHHSVARAAETHHGVHHHTHAAEHQGCGHHDHSQCSHPQLIADLASCKVNLVSSVSSLLKFFKSIPPTAIFPKVDGVKKDFSPPYFDTGPLGNHFSSIPLYLQISVLRI